MHAGCRARGRSCPRTCTAAPRRRPIPPGQARLRFRGHARLRTEPATQRRGDHEHGTTAVAAADDILGEEIRHSPSSSNSTSSASSAAHARRAAWRRLRSTGPGHGAGSRGVQGDDLAVRVRETATTPEAPASKASRARLRARRGLSRRRAAEHHQAMSPGSNRSEGKHDSGATSGSRPVACGAQSGNAGIRSPSTARRTCAERTGARGRAGAGSRSRGRVGAS
jgi:hypothetical protein